MVAAPSSGSGKTTLTCALLSLLKKHGKSPVAFKCGPDFIDPMFHEQVLGVSSENLDSFFCTEGQLRRILERDCRVKPGNDGDERCAVIEGVMGLFDGLGGKFIKASSYDIARITRTPILLVVDACGMSRSIVPLVKGFLDYDKKNSPGHGNLIKAVFLNRCSKGQFEILKPLIEEECAEYGVKVVGFLPKDLQNVWKSRHLGLVLPGEIENLRSQIEATADILEETLDFSAMEDIFTGALKSSLHGKLACVPAEGVGERGSGTAFTETRLETPNSSLLTPDCTIAVARDEAFCFYYRENLRVLEEMGAKITYFSPLHDQCVPPDARGILFGGGYPELYAAQLQENASMRKSVRDAVKNGVSVMAECGGFMYLQERIFIQDGSSYEMCGAIEGECRYTGKLVRFGYADFQAKDSPGPGQGGFTVKGHEFHYFDSTNNGDSFTATKPLSSRSWQCMIKTEKMLAGFPHLYYRSCPELGRWFLDSCKKG